MATQNQVWDFTLLDTGFFRSGHPFNAGEGGSRGIPSIFPPTINTMQGAIRTALATAKGWSPDKGQLPSELGSTDDLGIISLRGPYLLVDDEPYYQIPFHLLVKSEPGPETSKRFVFLTPGKPVNCDLGKEVCLPQPITKLEGAGSVEGLYVSKSVYTKILAGQLQVDGEIKKQIKEEDDLWLKETRVGLERSDETHTAEDSLLYRIQHIRPKMGVKIRVIVRGLPTDWPELTSRVLPLGGEGRLSGVEVKGLSEEDEMGFLPEVPELIPGAGGILRFTVSLITPGCFQNIEKAVRYGPPGIPGRCVSACLIKPQLIGGWDLVNREPRPLTPCLAPGCTWFFEGTADDLPVIKKLHGVCVGEKNTYGYGQIAMGKWGID